MQSSLINSTSSSMPAKAVAPKQLGAPKAKAPTAPGSKKSPLGFFEDRPINKS